MLLFECDASGHWFSNDYLLTILRALDCHDKENLDQAASEAVKDVERKLFCKLKDKGSEKEESLFDKSKDKTKDKEMLAARDWLLWQAYFS